MQPPSSSTEASGLRYFFKNRRFLPFVGADQELPAQAGIGQIERHHDFHPVKHCAFFAHQVEKAAGEPGFGVELEQVEFRAQGVKVFIIHAGCNYVPLSFRHQR